MDSTLHTLKHRAAAGAVAGALGAAAGYFAARQVQDVLDWSAPRGSGADPGTELLLTALRLLLALTAAFLLLWWMRVPGAALGAPLALVLQLVVEVIARPAAVAWITESPFAGVLDVLPPDGAMVFAVLFAAVMALAVAVGASASARDDTPVLH